MTTPKFKPKAFDVVAIGDIHATYEPYRQFLEWVSDSGAVVVLLGDLIDRGGEDLAVLEATRLRLEDPEQYGLSGFHALRGNHEQMFLDAVSEGVAPFRSSTVEWLNNGGNFKDSFEMSDYHEVWLRKLPIYMTIGDTLFIHAGLFPGHNPYNTVLNGKSQDLLWMREPFLSIGPGLESWSTTIKRVVHGHTPTCFEDYNKDNDLGFAPVITEERINIDTGSCWEEGFLTAYNVTQNTFQFFK